MRMLIPALFGTMVASWTSNDSSPVRSCPFRPISEYGRTGRSTTATFTSRVCEWVNGVESLDRL
eukprot:CAMPEP_0202854770 /NCGR_PEP_ID=MMETSP1389-20130828/91172_1 /ASSEMBLY_ACC=CAM_ASM_000865 /TAXON_ID=302021 /ORGANISM="Rhodomonas sp., Strain CCMP768" /LENGTH=63 /DNA_ID=CAMNT_0049533369 /DNA_START=502 /DNA_END=693 /DNA_ORIENTATION=-